VAAERAHRLVVETVLDCMDQRWKLPPSCLAEMWDRRSLLRTGLVVELLDIPGVVLGEEELSLEVDKLTL
jgi:hypothetical protein